MRVLISLWLGLACVPQIDAQGHALLSSEPAKVAAQFGVPARYDAGTLQYPGFTVNLMRKRELLRADGQSPWTIYTFEVLNEGHLTIGGDVEFDSEERANGRRFDVAGRIYVAELFFSTADVPAEKALPLSARLAANEIVIWDEATAAAHNAALAPIWRTEKIDPTAQYSVLNAYSGGVLLPGLSPPPGRTDDGQKRLKGNAREIERVTVLADAPVPPAQSAMCAYGERANINAGALKYPDLTVVQTERTETNPANPFLGGSTYGFNVFGAAPQSTGFRFNAFQRANACRFVVGGVSFVAEMFVTTASDTGRAGKRRVVSTPLGPDEIIIWNETTALRRNPRLAGLFQEEAPEGNRAEMLAAGVRLELPFMGTYMFDNAESCQYSELDAPLRAVDDGHVAYPKKYVGSGFVGRVGGFLFVERDGTVGDVTTTHGNNGAFRAPSAAAIRGMRFTPPRRNGVPTRVLMNFDWVITESGSDTRSVRFN